MRRAWPLVLTLAGCAGTAPGPKPAVQGGPVGVVFAGRAFAADLQPGPVLTISRDPGFGNFEGRLAKDVAQQFCADRGSRLNPLALGRFAAGAWVFEGGCA